MDGIAKVNSSPWETVPYPAGRPPKSYSTLIHGQIHRFATMRAHASCLYCIPAERNRQVVRERDLTKTGNVIPLSIVTLRRAGRRLQEPFRVRSIPQWRQIIWTIPSLSRQERIEPTRIYATPPGTIRTSGVVCGTPRHDSKQDENRTAVSAFTAPGQSRPTPLIPSFGEITGQLSEIPDHAYKGGFGA